MEATQLSEPGTRQDLETLVRQHQAMVWRYLRLLGADDGEADDLMQETFLRVARDAANLRFSAVPVDRVHAPAAYLRAIARNLLLGQRRAANRRVPTVAWSSAIDELVAENPRALHDAQLDALRHCRSMLRERARSAVELHYIEGLSYRESARRLGLRINGFRALLARVRHLLRDCTKRRIRGVSRA